MISGSLSAFQRWWRERAGRPVGTASDVSPVVHRHDQPTLADAHLVMNSLNQVAARMHSNSGEEDPRLFAVADYLRFVFQAGSDDRLPIRHELQLLQSYVQLIGRTRATEIPFEFSPGVDDDADVVVPRHLSCDLVTAFMRALQGDARKAAGLRVSFENGAMGSAYALRCTVGAGDVARLIRRLDTELAKIQERFASSGDVELRQSFLDAGTDIHADTDGAVSWKVDVLVDKARR